MTPMYRNTWNETDLRNDGWEYRYSFTCKECEEEVSVYFKLNAKSPLFLLPDMTVHPFHRREE